MRVRVLHPVLLLVALFVVGVRVTVVAAALLGAENVPELKEEAVDEEDSVGNFEPDGFYHANDKADPVEPRVQFGVELVVSSLALLVLLGAGGELAVQVLEEHDEEEADDAARREREYVFQVGVPLQVEVALVLHVILRDGFLQVLLVVALQGFAVLLLQDHQVVLREGAANVRLVLRGLHADGEIKALPKARLLPLDVLLHALLPLDVVAVQLREPQLFLAPHLLLLVPPVDHQDEAEHLPEQVEELRVHVVKLEVEPNVEDEDQDGEHGNQKQEAHHHFLVVGLDELVPLERLAVDPGERENHEDLAGQRQALRQDPHQNYEEHVPVLVIVGEGELGLLAGQLEQAVAVLVRVLEGQVGRA